MLQIWLAVATILASFDIGHKKDASGNITPLDIKWTDGLSRLVHLELPVLHRD